MASLIESASFSDVTRRDVWLAREISNGAGYLDDAIVTTGRQGQRLGCRMKQLLRIRREIAEQHATIRLSIGCDTRHRPIPTALSIASSLNSISNCDGTFRAVCFPERVQRNRAERELQVNAINERTRKPRSIALDVGFRTSAGTRRMAQEGARMSRGWSRRKLALAAHVDEATVRRIEEDAKRIARKSWTHVARALGLD